MTPERLREIPFRAPEVHVVDKLVVPGDSDFGGRLVGCDERNFLDPSVLFEARRVPASCSGGPKTCSAR